MQGCIWQARSQTRGARFDVVVVVQLRHLQESLSADGERVTDLQQQLSDCHAAMETFDEQAQAQVHPLSRLP